MARGREKRDARRAAIARLGKDLARRARQRCELCEGKGDLRPHDTAPEEEPSMERVALLCERCRAIAAGRDDDPSTLRFLEGAIWSPYEGVASTARAILARVDAEWARAALEGLG